MTFKVVHGDLFANVQSGLIVHGCNAQGVMGAGVAAIVRRMYPAAYDKYRAQSTYILGEVIPCQVNDKLVIINAITQDKFGADGVYADYDAIRRAMKGSLHLAKFYEQIIGCTDLHMPLIGGGLAGGDRDTILAIMGEELSAPGVLATLWLYP